MFLAFVFGIQMQIDIFLRNLCHIHIHGQVLTFIQPEDTSNKKIDNSNFTNSTNLLAKNIEFSLFLLPQSNDII